MVLNHGRDALSVNNTGFFFLKEKQAQQNTRGQQY